MKINKCNYLTVDVADINLEFLKFKNIFSSQSANECVSGKIQGGKIENFDLNKILVTASADIDFPCFACFLFVFQTAGFSR